MPIEKKYLKTLFLSIFALSFFQHAAALMPTKQTQLPAPFSYVENLYFQSPSKFIVVGDEVQAEKIMQPNLMRNYELVHIPQNQKKDTDEAVPTLEGTTLILMEHPNNFSFHFFHLLEHLVGAWGFYGHEHAQEVKHIIFAANGFDERQDWKGPNQINKHLLRALFPNAKVRTWQSFVRKYNQGLVRLEQAFISDRGIANFHPECAKVNKLLGAAIPHLQPKNLQSFADHIQAYAKTKLQTPSKRLRVTYLKRPPPRRLTPDIENKLIKKISSLSNVQLKVVDFAQIPFSQQIQTIGNTDVLISVHGNGLSHILFLPPKACVMEIFPPDNHHLDYRIFADARGIDYYGILYKDNKFLEKTQAYEIGSRGYPNGAIDILDVDLIVSTIEHRKL